jgi:Flp pilus assembly protein TadG
VKPMTHDPNQKGVVLIESAISLATFMLLLFGIIESGLMVWTYNTVAFAAREGTRYAAVRGANNSSPATASTVQTYVKSRAIGLDPTKMTVTTTWLPDNTPGNYVRVVVNYQYSMVTALFMSGSVTLTSTSRTVVLH